MKSLGNTCINGARKNVKDIVIFGNGDTFQLICKASSKNEGWMKSTKAMEIEQVGCVVQVTTQQGENVAEALTFVPGVKIEVIDGDIKNGRKLVPITKQKLCTCPSKKEESKKEETKKEEMDVLELLRTSDCEYCFYVATKSEEVVITIKQLFYKNSYEHNDNVNIVYHSINRGFEYDKLFTIDEDRKLTPLESTNSLLEEIDTLLDYYFCHDDIDGCLVTDLREYHDIPFLEK
jgi:hypothetical protein